MSHRINDYRLTWNASWPWYNWTGITSLVLGCIGSVGEKEFMAGCNSGPGAMLTFLIWGGPYWSSLELVPLGEVGSDGKTPCGMFISLVFRAYSQRSHGGVIFIWGPVLLLICYFCFFEKGVKQFILPCVLASFQLNGGLALKFEFAQCFKLCWFTGFILAAKTLFLNANC